MNNLISFKSILLAVALFSVLSVGLNPIAQASAKAGEEHGKSHHNTNFFPKPQPNTEKSGRPGMVELLEPKALAKVTGTEVTLTWKEVAGADSYRVQVATDPNFKWLVGGVSNDFVKGTSFKVSGLEAGQNYFWRVYAWKTDNDESWMSSYSKASSFKVQ